MAVRRIGVLLLTVWGACTLIFLITRFTGDPATLMAGPDASLEQLEQLRHQFGLDRPLLTQYFDYMGGILRGDLGISLRYNQPVLGLILERMPATLLLAAIGAVLATIVGTILGGLAALNRGKSLDYSAVSLSVLGQSIPPFWLGMMLVLILSVNLGWFPSGGSGTPAHLVLPAITLCVAFAARIVRVARGSLLDSLTENYIVAATAKGVPRWRIIARHAARNASIPVLTMVSITTAQMVSGLIITETIFSYPGIGLLLVQAVRVRDFMLIQGVVLFVSFVVVILATVTDIIHARLDPRVKLGGA